MALRDKLAERSYAHLEPGEQIQQVFLAQTGPNPLWSFLTYLISFWVKAYVVVVTDRGIVFLKASIWTPSSPKSVVRRLPRNTVLGPLSGLWGKMTIEGQRYYVHKRFHKDVAAADVMVTGGQALQAGQWPAQPPQQQAQPQQQWPAQPQQQPQQQWPPQPQPQQQWPAPQQQQWPQQPPQQTQPWT